MIKPFVKLIVLSQLGIIITSCKEVSLMFSVLLTHVSSWFLRIVVSAHGVI